ncbi:MAG: helix-turn-helix domain-containing protein [Pirellulaceae bacterium]|nr:helix-turn-helix domain-containing protein [Pirellulaceae bacterium]
MLSNEKIDRIRKLIDEGFSQRETAALVSVSRTTVRKIAGQEVTDTSRHKRRTQGEYFHQKSSASETGNYPKREERLAKRSSHNRRSHEGFKVNDNPPEQSVERCKKCGSLVCPPCLHCRRKKQKENSRLLRILEREGWSILLKKGDHH